jgi:hypothetical protein
MPSRADRRIGTYGCGPDDLLRGTQIGHFGSGSGDECDIASRLGRAFRAAGSAACGSTDRDAEGLEKVLAGVSIRHEDVRGDGERQSSGLPVSRGA